MKKIFLILLSSISIVYAQKATFKVQFSEPLAVFEFVRNITKNSPPNLYKNQFDSSAYNNDKYTNLLAKFESINYFYWYEYNQYPYGNKIGGNSYFLLCKNLIESKNLQEFESRSTGIIPNSDLIEFTKILTEFLPIYQQIILKPNKIALEKQMGLIRSKLKATDIGSVIDKVKKFHSSSWNTTKPFTLNVCPMPPGKSIHATAFFNYAFANLPSSQTDMDLILSFMFHESFHIIYDEQSLQFKLEFAKWFKENDSRYSKYAELLYNEAITTSLSSGYLYSTVHGSAMPNEKWYNNKYIASMAVTIYPLTMKYLNEGKPVDKGFINEYIRLYETNLPDWILALDNILADRFFLCEDNNTRRDISKKFGYRNINEAADELSSQNIEKMKSLPITKLVVITKEHQKAIELLKQSFAELATWRPDADSDFSYYVFLPDKTFLIIVNTVTRPAVDILTEVKLN